MCVCIIYAQYMYRSICISPNIPNPTITNIRLENTLVQALYILTSGIGCLPVYLFIKAI